MPFLDRFSRGELPLGRIEAFSDGVFAVVVTLLVLDLKVPTLADHASVRELAAALADQAPKFVSWLISFVIVCKFWLNHHHVLGIARHATYGLVWINSLFLLMQSMTPFPTALMGEYPGNPLAVGLFGVVMALNTLLFMALHAYVLRKVLKPERAAEQLPDVIARSWIGVASYLVGVAAAWIHPYLAFVAYAVTPVFFIVPPTRPALVAQP